MTNKLIFRIYGIILAVFVTILVLSIALPYTCATPLIHIIWGEETCWYEAVLTVSLNLLYGLISSTILALFISFITYQYDILRDETEYLNDVRNIAIMCRNSLSRQDINQIASLIEIHNQQAGFVDEKIYRKSLMHSPKAKKEIQDIINTIEELIGELQHHCQDMSNEMEHYDELVEQYRYNLSRIWCLRRYSKEYIECSRNMSSLINLLEELRRSKMDKFRSMIEPVKALNERCNDLGKYISWF